MDCHEAQRIVSETLDGETLDAALVSEAKEHCRVCSGCATYVSALVKVHQLPLPAPPQGLTERIIAAVREEASSAPRPEPVAAEAPPSAADTLESAPAAQPESLTHAVITYLTDPRRRRAVATWTTAAAVLLVVTTVTAVSGIRQITNGTRAAVESTSKQPDALMYAQDATAESANPAPSVDGGAMPGATAPASIVVGGVVYQSGGVVSDMETSTLSPMGTTRSSLDVGGAPTQRQVLGHNDPARVYVVNDVGELVGFDRVVRTYRSRSYALASNELATFGVWPTLPSGVSPPSEPNGMPEYVPAGTDDLGVEVYRPAAGGTEGGFAIAPGTSPSDPAAGNPGWTWWVPAR